MAVRAWTNQDLVKVVKRRLTGSKANPSSNEVILDEMNFAWQEVVAIGDEVGDHGWIFLAENEDITVAASGGLTTNPITITQPMHRIITLRTSEQNVGPTSLEPVSSREAWRVLWDRDRTGRAERYWVEDFQESTGQYQLFIHPTPTTAYELNLLYARQADEVTSSPFSADNIRLPNMYKEIVVEGTLMRLMEHDSRSGRMQRAEANFNRARSRLLMYAYTQMEENLHVVTDSEVRLRASRVGLDSAYRRYGFF